MKKGKAIKIIVMFGMVVYIMVHYAGYCREYRFWHRGSSDREIVIMAGSTSMEKLAIALAESFMEKYPYVKVNAEFTGSSAGIESMLAGTAHIGNSSRTLSEQEKAAGAVENIVAVEGIVVIMDTSNIVTVLTMEQLTDIYAGRIRNWRELGGKNEPIVVIGREAGSGTRETFERLLGLEYKCIYANELDSTGAVMARVSSIPGAIGYVSRDVLDDTVQVVSINGFEPTDSNILEGRYPLSRTLIMATKGEIQTQETAVQELFEYLHSKEGKQLIELVGLIVPESGIMQ